ncbi:hypothetical protein B0T17DRAFT_152730 [Bombardia bombarda]|uniref:Uncharacterized protein n=1 Tax=Bombardia bombarda TaxID=252184 RepID=A0AA39X6Y4_9PEZI|nr:hypothetical protein B0T17DRAFT_152730 [Bombardia bombarda]
MGSCRSIASRAVGVCLLYANRRSQPRHPWTGSLAGSSLASWLPGFLASWDCNLAARSGSHTVRALKVGTDRTLRHGACRAHSPSSPPAKPVWPITSRDRLTPSFLELGPWGLARCRSFLQSCIVAVFKPCAIKSTGEKGAGQISSGSAIESDGWGWERAALCSSSRPRRHELRSTAQKASCRRCSRIANFDAPSAPSETKVHSQPIFY